MGRFIDVTLFDAEGEEYVASLPAMKIVCERCDGTGQHVNPAIDGHGLSREDFDDDPDFEEAYFAGYYDVPCYDCRGERVRLVINEARAEEMCPVDYRRWVEAEQDRADMYAEMEAERRMGA